MPRIVSFGEALIDMFAEPGVTLHEAKALHPAPGGAPANVAVALARLGTDVGFIGKVGTDAFGLFLIDLLANEGVDTTHFTADPGAPTMLAIIAAPSPEEQHFVLYHGADALLKVEELPQPYIEAADVFIYGSVTLANASREAALQAARWVKEAGKNVIFDVNLRPALWPDLEIARDRIEEAIASATVVKLNQVELEFLTGVEDPSQGSRQIIERGPQLCCVSLGGDGAYFNNGYVKGRVSAYDVEVANTTGSGDAFVAGLAYQLSNLAGPIEKLDQAAVVKIISFANACAGLAATRVGAMSALPTKAAVDAFLSEH